MTDQLPNWVYDVVIALHRWEEEHPLLYRQAVGSDEYVKAPDCGCAAYYLVPADVREQAAVLAEYLRQAEQARGQDMKPVGEVIVQ